MLSLSVNIVRICYYRKWGFSDNTVVMAIDYSNIFRVRFFRQLLYKAVQLPTYLTKFITMLEQG